MTREEELNACSEEELDEKVYEAKAEEAADINNDGKEAQIAFLLGDPVLSEVPARHLRFVLELFESVQRTVTTAIQEGRIPERWDGHELRQYVADKFNEARSGRIKGQRKRAYTNDVLNENL